jgi:signal transduction histidine kinase
MPERPHAITGQPRRVGGLRAPDAAWDEGPAARRAARGRRVARDLVELSRLQRGDERAQSVPVDLANLLRAICADYPELLLEGPQPLPFNTDSRRLARALSALLDNACLHGAPPITVRYDAAEIVVEDCGPGLAPALLQRATEPFVTGDRTRGRGVGLGLAIAARQAAVLGAELRLSNAPCGGTIAQLRFDAAATATATASAVGA